MRVLNKQLSGLGNQLFQYAAGTYFANQYRGKLEIFEDLFEGTLSHGQYARPFLLPKFSITAPFRPKSRFDELMLSLGPRSLRASLPIKRLGRIVVRHEPMEQRYHFLKDLEVPPGTRTLYLSGFWQAHQYAHAVAEQLRQEFQLREPVQGRNLATLQHIQTAPSSVSLHMRRGDYTLAAEGNRVLSLDYYRRAIKLIRERVPEPVFFVFSDDIEFARANLPTNIHCVFVEGNDDFAAQEDLRLMSCCRHHIIANSSFSWWGAWLNANKDKTVVAPKHWYLTPDSFYPDLFPPGWHTLDSLRQS